jgi:hypothetical protein
MAVLFPPVNNRPKHIETMLRGVTAHLAECSCATRSDEQLSQTSEETEETEEAKAALDGSPAKPPANGVNQTEQNGTVGGTQA